MYIWYISGIIYIYVCVCVLYIIISPIYVYLVGGSYPSEKYESQLGLLFPVYGKIKNVPNHQPDRYIYIYIYWALPRDTNSDHNSYHKKKHKKNQVVVPNMTLISPY